MLNNTQVYDLLSTIACVYQERQKELADLDAVIGDGDHGYSLARGNKAALLKVIELGSTAAVSELFKQYGRELTCEVGGAMGPLFGLLFTQIGKACTGSETLGLSELSVGLGNAMMLICELGGAAVGDKTMVDAIAPAVAALEDAEANGLSLVAGLKKAVDAARDGVHNTIPLQARRGRSKYLREKSIGHQDAGATSFYYLVNTMYCFVSGGC